MSNFFTHLTAAQRYASARPYFHPVVIERLLKFTGLTVPLKCALDVACGTGQSTRALVEIADSVIGIDSSKAMMQQAPSLPNVGYKVASAENIPFEPDSFNLITVGLAFHWFDQDIFLEEAARVLQLAGWLVIYDNGFRGEMRGERDFATWMETYWQRYPSPPRGRKDITKERAVLSGLTLKGSEKYNNEVQMSQTELADYLLTQSNVISAVEDGNEKIEEVAAWVNESIKSFFNGEPRTMLFTGTIEYLQKENAA